MLNFAVERISDAGHQTEIASLTTASSNFGVFNGVVMHSLHNIMATDEWGLERALPDFKKMCGQTEQTYLYTQALLAHLQRVPNGYHLKRLSQELHNASLEQLIHLNTLFLYESSDSHILFVGSAAG